MKLVKIFFTPVLFVCVLCVTFFGFHTVPYSVLSMSTLASAQTSFTASTLILNRNLREGDTGEDVLLLQKFLNNDRDTQISEIGSGSPGNETRYFGRVTKNAVMRLQDKYKDEILVPAGQLTATGFVGFWTRQVLQRISSIPTTETSSKTQLSPDFLSQVPVTEENVPIISPVSSLGATNEVEKPQISSLSRYSAQPGASISITGLGFSGKNTINLGKNKIKDVVASSSTRISFQIPENINVGRYDVFVTTQKSKISNTMPFMVTSVGAIVPKVDTIEPSRVKFGDRVTITGENFTPVGNIVTFGLGKIDNLPSRDGRTIVFTVKRPSQIQDSVEPGDSSIIEWPMNVTVVNTNGISKNGEKSTFVLER